MAAKLILVRHGETLLNREGRVQGVSDAPLSDLGESQARAVAEALAPDAPFRLYASPLSRAAQTARPIADAHGAPPLADMVKPTLAGQAVVRGAERASLSPPIPSPRGRGLG